MQPLTGVRVLDFSTLLPGPMATLLLAEAGAEVIKIERPGRGEDMRAYRPNFGSDSVNFALLNRGKRSIAIDLKDPQAASRLRPLIESADVLVEQFRPGVMDRLGLGFDAVHEINPRLVYCSITGYGQQGPKAQDAGHDLNYIAETGLLNIAADDSGSPVVPPALIADIAGGSYPAVLNILLALRQRDQTGAGCHLDVAMCDGMFTFMYWAIGNGQAASAWPKPGGELVTGGSPRYQIYRTADDCFIAAGPLEQKFWDNFCEAIGLDPALRNDVRDPQATRAGVAAIIRTQSADHWRQIFAGKDVCCCVVASLEEAMQTPHFRERGLFDAEVSDGQGNTISATPVPIAPAFRSRNKIQDYPQLGEANDLL